MRRTDWKNRALRAERELDRVIEQERERARQLEHRVAELQANPEDAAYIIAGLKRNLADAEAREEEIAKERDEAQERADEFEADAELTRSLAAALGGNIRIAMFRAGLVGEGANTDDIADAIAEMIDGPT